MARLFRPVTRMISSSPDATASSTTYWMVGLSTSGNISLGCALVAGRKRVPSPAAGNTAFLTLMSQSLSSTDATLQNGPLRTRSGSSWAHGLVVRSSHLDPQFLDAIPEAALGDPENLGRARLDSARLLESVQDQPPLRLGENV